MKANDIPCPYPPNFIESEPLEQETQPTPTSPAYWSWGPKGGHLEDATKEFYEATWNVPNGRRKG